MTICIAEKTFDGKILFGCDSAQFHCDNYFKEEGVNKISQAGDIYMLGTGHACHTQTLANLLEIKKPELNNILDVYTVLNELYALTEKTPDKEWMKNTFYIADKKTFKLFKVVEGSSVYEMKEGEFDMIGQGFELAMYLHNEEQGIKYILQEVIRTHTYTGGEPNVLEIKRDEPNC